MPQERSDTAPRVARSPARIRAELADLERFLAETPPHHGAGVRASLEARRTALQQELARTTP
ncbi:MAG: hypothetical protein ACLFUG_09005 [Nitriliruptoraceae bacterium]